MAALCSICGHYIFILSFLHLSSFFFSVAYSQPAQIGCLPYFHTWRGLSANLGYRSETCCEPSQLAEKYRKQKIAKNSPSANHRKLCWAISSQLRHVSTTGKRLVKQQYSPHMSLQYGELRSTSGRDWFVSLGHPS